MRKTEGRVGETTRRLRALHRWSRRELARRAGLNPESLAAIERGEADPRTGTVVAIADALGVSPAMLLGWAGTEAEDMVGMYASLGSEDRAAVRRFVGFLLRERVDRLLGASAPAGTAGRRARVLRWRRGRRAEGAKAT
jgi:transcriptional regulator with XRE-family HTH domain